MPPLTDQAELANRLAAARVGRLATIRPDGSPRLVPITFAVVGGAICSAVETVKPKTTTRLARLADVRRDPRVALLVDRYDEDWRQLWWVRVDGTAAIHDEHPEAAAALQARYEPYRGAALTGPFLVITARSWTGWTAT